MLRSGHHRVRPLLAEWNSHGEASFLFEILETLDPDVPSLSVPDLLKEKKRYWANLLGALILL